MATWGTRVYQIPFTLRFRRALFGMATLVALVLASADGTAGTLSLGNSDSWGLYGRNGWHRTAPQWPSPPGHISNLNVGSAGTGGNTTAGAGASLSGFVWYDPDRDGVYDNLDSPIHDAHILLYSMSDLDHPIANVYTDNKGIYQFSGLAAGTYALTLGYPSSPDGKDFVGSLVDPDGALVTSGAGTLVAEKDTFLNIVLGSGYKGRDYNFAEVVCPISKRSFVTPEPGSIVLLAGAALGGGLACFLRRRMRARRRSK